jgi:hypothetical protein
MASVDGILFGVINIVGNFGTVFVDNVSFALIPKNRFELSRTFQFNYFLSLIPGILAESNRSPS